MGHGEMWGKSTARAGMMALTFSVAAMGLSATGCRITDDDVSAWARKSSGPRKLVAVLQHDKYDLELRVNAAMTLVTMKPRGGRAVGLLGGDEYIGLLDALHEMSVEDRAPIIEGMIPKLVEGISLVPEGEEQDASIPYKDASYALMTHDEGAIITEPKQKAELNAALVGWAQQNFVARMDDTTQLFGMEQVLRHVRAPGVKGLTSLITSDFKKTRQLAGLIKELGDDPTKLDASSRMVKVASHIDSDAWIKQKSPAVEAANEASGFKVKPKQFQKQLEAFQEEELLRIFGAMKNVGQKPIVDYLLAYAAEAKNPEKRRAAALAGLEGNLDRKNETHAKQMLDYLSNDDTPDVLRDVASRRVGELSRDQVAERLYGLFDHKRWQLRSVVASLLFKMSEAKQLDELMGKLGKVKHMALSEPLMYGPLLAEIKGDTVENIAEKFSKANYPAPVRLTALGYYYNEGTKADLSKVEPYKSDSQKVPACHKDAQQCAWSCTVKGKKGPEAKTVNTVGQFVQYCLLPAMSEREPQPKKKDDGKKDKK